MSGRRKLVELLAEAEQAIKDRKDRADTDYKRMKDGMEKKYGVPVKPFNKFHAGPNPDLELLS